MDNATNNMPSAAGHGEGNNANAGRIVLHRLRSRPNPMHGEAELDKAHARMLADLDKRTHAAIWQALVAGFQRIGQGRAEDAIKAAAFIWPNDTKPRVFGAIVKKMARAGLIREVDIVKGYTGRSHAGRVSVWSWLGGAA
jgi:hypothetical protein